MSCVYWIHLPEHTDITSEGYVGIALDFKKRFREHKSAAKRGDDYVIYRAIRKYEDTVIFEVVLEGSEDYCKLIENKLRPESFIGWNMAVGGQDSVMSGRKHSEEAKEKMRDASKTKSPELQAYQNTFLSKGIPLKDRSRVKEWKRATGAWRLKWANKDAWAESDKIYLVFKENPSFGPVKIRNYLNLPKSMSLDNILKKIKETNWNPLEDSEWIEWVQTFKNEKELLV